MGHRSELDRLRQQRDELASMLGQHRQTVRLQQDWSFHPSCCCSLLPCHYCRHSAPADDMSRSASRSREPGYMCDFQCDLLQVSAMTKDTQDIMARAQEQSNTADAQAAELQRVRMLQSHHGTA
jgi:hypothetical protein